MNFKKLFSSAVVGLSMMALAGTASAAYITADINIYGASAEFNFWKANGGTYLSNNHCNNIQYAIGVGTGSDKNKHFIISGDCQKSATDTTRVTHYMRISSKASYDGILAVSGNSSNFAARVTDCDVSGNSGSYYQRKMADISGITWGTLAAPGVVSATTCTTVTVGASDTKCSCFTQKSKGDKLGPLGGTSPYGMDMTGLPCPTTSESNICTPLIVPFTFYVNNLVTKNSATITSLSYDNLQLIFSGNVFNWGDIYDADGVAYDSKALVACMRHAGSGTEASLEAYLMASPNCSKDNYLWWQQSASSPTVYFNDGSGDEMNCVNGSGAWTAHAAIGFADADQDLSTYANTTRISIGGVPAPPPTMAAIRAAIIDGSYNFYGQQHLYGVAPTDPLCTFFGDITLPSTSPWALSSDMTYKRNNTCCSWGLSFP